MYISIDSSVSCRLCHDLPGAPDSQGADVVICCGLFFPLSVSPLIITCHAGRYPVYTHSFLLTDIEVKERQARYSRGLRALLDRVTGKRQRIRQQNECESLEAYQRDREERDALIFEHNEHRRALQARIERLQSFAQLKSSTLYQEMRQYQEMQRGECEAADLERRRPRHRIPRFEPEM